MVTFRNNNNNRRPNFRRNDRGFKPNGDRSKYKSNFSSNDSFQRKVPGRNNHNASNLVEKYNDLAREALAHEDKILSENYFQHADHFKRVLAEKQQVRSSDSQKDSDKTNKELNSEKKDKDQANLVVDKLPEKQVTNS
jgi:hypothetical protein